MRLEVDNLRSALDWVRCSESIEDGLWLLVDLNPLLIAIFGQTETMHWLDALLTYPVHSENTRGRALAYLMLDDLYGRRGEFDHGLVALERANAIAIAIGDLETQAHYLVGLAAQAGWRQEYALAREYTAKWRAFFAANKLMDDVSLNELESEGYSHMALLEGKYDDANTGCC